MARGQKDRKHNGQRKEGKTTQLSKERMTDNTMAKGKKDRNTVAKGKKDRQHSGQRKGQTTQ